MERSTRGSHAMMAPLGPRVAGTRFQELQAELGSAARAPGRETGPSRVVAGVSLHRSDFVLSPCPHKGSLVPRRVSVSSEGGDGITVTWQPPGHGGPAVRQYVVEWTALPGHSSRPPLSWLRVSPSSRSAVISGTVATSLPGREVVFTRGAAGAGFGYGADTATLHPGG